MEILSRLEQLRDEVSGAKAVPLSASCLVNRNEMLDIIDAAIAALPADINRASDVLSQREALIARATDHARELVDRANTKQAELVAEHTVYQRAHEAAQALQASAEAEAQAIRARADDYVDSQLANLEVALQRIGTAVSEGRDRLSGRRAYDALGAPVQEDSVPAPTAERLSSDSDPA